MKVEMRPLESITPYNRNPRRNEDAIDKVASAIKEFGWRQPIVVDSNGVIIVGHTRYAAAKELGEEIVPIHVADNLSAKQIKAYRLADNRVHDESSWDDDLLTLELGDLLAEDFDLELTGFDEDEIDRLLGSENDGEGSGEGGMDEDDHPVSRPGDVWLLGNITLQCSNSSKFSTEDAFTADSLIRQWERMSGNEAFCKKTKESFSQESVSRAVSA